MPDDNQSASPQPTAEPGSVQSWVPNNHPDETHSVASVVMPPATSIPPQVASPLPSTASESAQPIPSAPAPQVTVQPTFSSQIAPDTAANQSSAPANTASRKRLGLGIGIILFVIFMLILLSPLLPGKIWRSGLIGDGSSQISGTTKVCDGAVGSTTNRQGYQDEHGFPLVYKYSIVSESSWTCNGRAQPAARDTVTNTNLVAALLDVACAVVLAIMAGLLVKTVRKKSS